MKKITILDMVKLPPKKANFIVEYIKDFAPRRAAEASGFNADHGYTLLSDPDISAAIEHIIQKRLEVNMIDSDWLLNEMVDNHMIARQQGNISASNTALSMVGKHKQVDAFSAEKLKVFTDQDTVDRLKRVRDRMRKAEESHNDEITFI